MHDDDDNDDDDNDGACSCTCRRNPGLHGHAPAAGEAALIVIIFFFFFPLLVTFYRPLFDGDLVVSGVGAPIAMDR